MALGNLFDRSVSAVQYVQSMRIYRHITIYIYTHIAYYITLPDPRVPENFRELLPVFDMAIESHERLVTSEIEILFVAHPVWHPEGEIGRHHADLHITHKQLQKGTEMR